MDRIPATFEVLLWNMQKCGGDKWRSDFLQLIHDRHLVLLQEASLTAVNLEIFDQHEQYYWTLARSFRHLKKESENGVQTGCRCAPLESSGYASPNAEPLVQTHKMLLDTCYPLAGSTETLKVLNIHALNFAPINAYKKHMSQIGMAVESHQGPMILAGDFNTWSKQRYSVLQQTVLQLGLSEADISRKTKARHFYSHLDHLFYRGLSLDNIELVDSVTSSDHLPIIARLSTI